MIIAQIKEDFCYFFITRKRNFDHEKKEKLSKPKHIKMKHEKKKKIKIKTSPKQKFDNNSKKRNETKGAFVLDF